MKRIGKNSLASKVALLIFGMLTVQASYAQDSSSTQASGTDEFILEEVIVTARRREERLQDIPSSITAFSSDDILRNNINDITDYFSKTPNVSFTESGTRGERSISIRGVSNIGGQANALAFYVDDFNIVNGPQTANTGNSNSSVNPQLLDVERIEVLRGPQGTYFGRNATGGAINVTTKKPGPDPYGELNAGFGRLSSWNLSGIVNMPIVDDRVFFRALASYEESDGFVKNVTPAGGRSDTQYFTSRAALRFVPNENVLIDFSVNYTNEEQGLPEITHDGNLSDGSAGLSAAVGFPNGIDEVGFFPENLKRVSYDLSEQQENEFLTLVMRIEVNTDAFTFTSITGYLDTEFSSTDNDLDGSSFGFLDQDRNVTTDTFSQEIRLSGDANESVSWVVGGIYAEDDRNQKFSVVPGPDGFLGLPQGFLIDTGDITFETDSWAIFGEVSWKISDRITVTGGGRYTDDSVFQRVEGVNFGAPDEPGQGEVGFDDFSPRFTVSYEASDDLTLYAAASKGYKAGGLQLNVTQQLPILGFDEETIWNYEGGYRLTSMNGRLRTNLTLFYMDWSDLQVSTNLVVVDPVTNEITFLNVTNNAASASSKGAEFDFRALLSENFEIGGSIGYLKAEFDNFTDAIVLGDTVDLSGKDIPRAPEWTTSVDAEYRFPLTGIGQAFLRAEWSYRDKSFPTLDDHVVNPQQHIAGSFDLLNIRIGIDADKYRVDAYIENALDEVYTTTSGGFGFAGARFHPTYRTYGVRVKYVFN